MARKLAWLSLIIGLTAPVWAAGSPGTISGSVKDSSGVPQMGATVEILGGSPVPVATVFTGPTGAFVAQNLAPGSYFVRVTAPLFLPSLREGVALHSGASVVLHVTLNTLSEALEMLPVRRRTPADQDDWKWTVRSGANRPVLRVLDHDSLVMVSQSDKEEEKILKARIAFLAGTEGNGFGDSADMSTAFNLESSLFSAGMLSLKGNVGYEEGQAQGTAVRASYSHKMPDGSEPRVSLSIRRFATPETVVHDGALQALALSLSDSRTLFNFIDVTAGSEFQTIQFRGHVSALRPFGSAAIHVSPNAVLEYRYASSVPDTRGLKGFSSASADLSESGPRFSLQNGRPKLERARHHEVSLSRRVGKNSAQVAWYSDHIRDVALTGVGEVSSFSGDVLPDVYSGTFTYTGRNLDTSGLRLVLQRKLSSELTATVDYSYGGVVKLDESNAAWQDVRSALSVEQQHALTYKMGGAIPRSHTQWSASYKWTSGGAALTPVDMFNVSAGQSDSYLNIFIRQPIPAAGFMAGRVEALVDVRNLMAQGYVPVMGKDGHTLYLVQSARSIRGGVAFTF